jgi:hypothetical protein
MGRRGKILAKTPQVSGRATSPYCNCNGLVTWNVAMWLPGCSLNMTEPRSIELSWVAHVGLGIQTLVLLCALQVGC